MFEEDLHIVACAEFSEEIAQRLHKPQQLHLRGMQTPRNAVDIGSDFASHGDERIELLGERRAALQRGLFQALKIDAEKREPLAGVVVEIAGNASAFLLLCAHEAAAQKLQFFFGAAALGNVLIESE